MNSQHPDLFYYMCITFFSDSILRTPTYLRQWPFFFFLQVFFLLSFHLIEKPVLHASHFRYDLILSKTHSDSDDNDGDAPNKFPWRKDQSGKDAGVPDFGADSGSDDDDGDARNDVPRAHESADHYEVLDNGTAGTVLGVPAGADDQSVTDDNDQDGNESSPNPTNVNNDEGAGNVASSG